MMKKILIILLICSTLSSASAAEITGRVSCGGAAVAGVVVSDGEAVTTTDQKGNYSLQSSMRTGYVFLSIPSGYEVPAQGLIPRHFVRVEGKVVNRADFELIKCDNNDYTLFVLADIHLTNTAEDKDIEQFRRYFVPDFKQTLARTKGKRYILTLGDMTTDSRWYKNKYGLPEYLKEMESIDSTPIFHSMGNHDNDPKCGDDIALRDSIAVQKYRQIIGPSYYSFNLGAVHYVVLDNIVYKGANVQDGKTKYIYDTYIDPVQLKWLEADLSHVERSTPIVVAMHAPLFRYKGITAGNPIVEESFKERDAKALLGKFSKFKTVHFLTGHTHQNYNYVHNSSIMEHNVVSVAASSWKVYGQQKRHISKDGTPGGYMICTMKGKDISWVLKGLGTDVAQSQFIVYDLNSTPTDCGGKRGSNQLLINVYNWDSRWKISVKEDGREIDVVQSWQKDPLYRLVSKGVFAPTGSTFSPINNSHIFIATAYEQNSTIVVEVTDRFSNKYSQTITRPKPFSWDMK